MKSLIQNILEASTITFSEKKYLVAFLLLWAIFFLGMFVLPLEAIPGNDLIIQTSLFAWKDYLLLAILSKLSSLVVIFQIYIFQKGYGVGGERVGGAAVGGLSVILGIFSSLFSLATCVLCAGTIFSFIGFSTLLMIASGRWYILGAAFLLLLLSLMLSSRRLVEGCRACRVEEESPS